MAGSVDIKGASATNTVTLNGQTITYRKGEYFRKELTVSNSTSALWTNIIVTATGQASVTGNVFVAQTPEDFSYDADGNLTNDGRWAYTWDAENRLVKMTVNTNVGPQYQLTFAYDSKGRRIQKIVATNSGSAYVVQYTNKFFYDGWNLVAELTPNNSLIRSYVWGNDLSGSIQGAGGVGGLLMVKDTASGTNFCAYDGNGNVAGLINAADGTVSATYEYGPFGEVIRATGPMAKVNPFRFSTKYQDDETDLLYYGQRYYNPSTGRWPNRDPIGERGSINLYDFVGNNPVTQFDPLGLQYGPGYPMPPGYPWPPPPPPTAFSVVGTEINVDVIGALLQAMGVDHVDIAYNGSVIYVGKGGAAGRMGQKYPKTNHTYPLSKRTTGELKYGKNAKCLKCKDATEADVLDCLQKRPPTPGANCQGDVQGAVGDCCLSGFTTIVGTFFPNISN